MAVFESTSDVFAAPTGVGGATVRVSSASTTYSVLSIDSVIVVERVAVTAMTVKLPPAVGSGRVITIKRNVGDMSVSLTLDANGSELIDGVENFAFSPSAVAPSATVKDDVSGEWIII